MNAASTMSATAPIHSMGERSSPLHVLSGSEFAPGVFGVDKIPLKEGVGKTRNGLPAVQDGALDVEVVEANRCLVQQLRIADFDHRPQQLRSGAARRESCPR